MMTAEAASGCVEGSPWVQNPQQYLQQVLPRLLGHPPECTTSQICGAPPLFECHYVADAERNLVGVGLGASKREAERYAAIQLCRILDASGVADRDQLQALLAQAVRQPPEPAKEHAWFSNPFHHLICRFGSEGVQCTVFPVANYFLTVISVPAASGSGVASNKKESKRLACMACCLKLEQSPPASGGEISIAPDGPSATNGAEPKWPPPVKKVPADKAEEQLPSPPLSSQEQTILIEYEEGQFPEESWHFQARDMLCQYLATIQRDPPIYESSSSFSSTTSTGEVKLWHICRASLPGTTPLLVGLGRASTSEQANRLATLALISTARLGQQEEAFKSLPVEPKPAPVAEEGGGVEADEIQPSCSLEVLETVTFAAANDQADGTDGLPQASQEDSPAEIDTFQDERVAPKGALGDKRAPSPSGHAEPAAETDGSAAKKAAIEDYKTSSQKEEGAVGVHGEGNRWLAAKSTAAPNLKLSETLKSALIDYVARHLNVTPPKLQYYLESERDKSPWCGQVTFPAGSKDGLPIVVCGHAPTRSGVETWLTSQLCRSLRDKFPKLTEPFIRNYGRKGIKEKKTIAKADQSSSSLGRSQSASLSRASLPSHASTSAGTLATAGRDEHLPTLSLIPSEKVTCALIPWLREARNLGRLLQAARLVNDPAFSSSAFSSQLPRDPRTTLPTSAELLEAESVSLLESAISYRDSSEGRAWTRHRQLLPAYECQDGLIGALASHQVVMLLGRSGCGKSTQVPNLILENMTFEGYGAQCNILAVEPCHIASSSLANRVAAERGEPLGLRVGYHGEGDSCIPGGFGGITYCTTDVLLEKLVVNPHLYGYSHIIIDEALPGIEPLADLVLSLLHDLLAMRPELRLVIMASRAEDFGSLPHHFQKYVSTLLTLPCQSIPIKTAFLEELVQDLDPHLCEAEDSAKFLRRELSFSRGEAVASETDPSFTAPFSLIEALLGHICHSTAPAESILVFFPGPDEVSYMHERLIHKDSLRMGYGNHGHYQIYEVCPQDGVSEGEVTLFADPPHGVRKILLASALAEAWLSVADIAHVVDCGRTSVFGTRSKLRDGGKGLDRSCRWISKSGSFRRRDKVGLSLEYGYYYCLMSRRRFEGLDDGCPPLPVTVSDLEGLCLWAKWAGTSLRPGKFFQRTIPPPPPDQVAKAVRRLQQLGALAEETEEITSLGTLLSRIPLPPMQAKMVLQGILMRCLDAVLVAAAAFNGGVADGLLDVEGTASGTRQGRRFEDYRRDLCRASSMSDQLAIVLLYQEWLRVCDQDADRQDEVQWCRERGISQQTLRQLHARKQILLGILLDSGILETYRKVLAMVTRVPDDTEKWLRLLNENSKRVPVVKAAVLAGLHHNAAVTVEDDHRRCLTRGGTYIYVHPGSVNNFEGGGPRTTMGVAYQEQVAGKRSPYRLAVCTTFYPALPIFLFATRPLLSAQTRTDSVTSLRLALRADEDPFWRLTLGTGGLEDESGLRLLKLAYECSVAYLLRLVATDLAVAESSLQPAEFTREEVVSYCDKVLRAVTAILDDPQHGLQDPL